MLHSSFMGNHSYHTSNTLATYDNGNRILQIGAQNGLKKIVKLALIYGADIDKVNSSGNSALHFCWKYGFGETLGRY